MAQLFLHSYSGNTTKEKSCCFIHRDINVSHEGPHLHTLQHISCLFFNLLCFHTLL